MHLLGRTWRKWRLYAYVSTIAVLIVTLMALYNHDTRRQHVLSRRPDMAELTTDYAEAHSDVKRDEIDTVCRFHGFRSYGRPRKVYDLVVLTGDLDWLEIRLNTLAAHVDYFVIADSSTTLNGSAKTFDSTELHTRFADFQEKIVYQAITIPVARLTAVDRTSHLRDAGLTEALASSNSTGKMPQDGDVLIVGDVYELPRPGTLSILRHCDFPSRTTLASQSFLYSFALHRVGLPWLHPQATTFGSSLMNTILPSDLRNGLLPWSLRGQDILYLPYQAARRWWDRAVFLDAAWYCYLCHGTIEEVRKELEELKGAEAAGNASMIMEHVRAGQDLLEGEDDAFKLVEQNRLDLPDFVFEQWKEYGRFGYLVDRSGSMAGFEDVFPGADAG